jgi:hypothetical protein
MSDACAVRYRGLALASDEKSDAELLLKLADECDRDFLVPSNGRRLSHTTKLRSRPKRWMAEKCGADWI